MPDRGPRGSILRGIAALTVALLPSVAAIWARPTFVTQDGPSHVYNARILLDELRLGEASPFDAAYEPKWRPLPNLGGHLALMGLLTAFGPRDADRWMTSITVVGPASAILWLRWRVSGPRGLGVAVLPSALLAINMPWLMGFANFLVGVALTAWTWGLWWGWRDRLGPWRAAAIGALLVIGYLGHVVSLGLTAGGLVLLALLDRSAGGINRGRCVGWTLAACLPLIPLGLLYRSLTGEGGAFAPEWEQDGPVWSPIVWARRASWIDPITIGRRDIVPLVPERFGPWAIALDPALWFGLAATFAGWGTLRRRAARNEPPDGRSAWAALALLLLLGAAVGPDGFGDDHGYFLAQRVALVGLIALLPALELGVASWSGRVVAALFGVALTLQSAFVWDYGIESERRAGALARAPDLIERGERVGTILAEIRGRYRANPLLHADGLVGAESGAILWSNYESRHYYFPVQVRDGVDAPPSLAFEQIALLEGPEHRAERARRWAALLEEYGAAIDAVLAWGTDPALDAITERWAGGGPIGGPGVVRVYRRQREGPLIE